MVLISEDDLLPALLNRAAVKASRTLASYVEELLNDEVMARHFEQTAQRRQHTKYANWQVRVTAFPGNVAIYYALVRELRPNVIVETGTATGSMTSYLLAALHRNGGGRLISIDLPPVAGKLTMDLTLADSDIGYWIPPEYRGAWRYLKGDAKVLLPKVMTEQPVEFFIHDSLHTRTHMTFEYSVARALMKSGSVIVSDDVLWNNAFDDFLATHGIVGYAGYRNPNVAVTLNEFDQYEKEIGLGVVNPSATP